MTLNILSPFPVALLLFLISLVIVTATSAWFTRRLEALCELFCLSIGILSLLSAIGANIPNYAASVVAIISGHIDVGIGIIVGSSIYNIAIALGLCTLALRETSGIALNAQELQDARGIAWYALAIMLSILVAIALLPSAAVTVANRRAGVSHLLPAGCACSRSVDIQRAHRAYSQAFSSRTGIIARHAQSYPSECISGCTRFPRERRGCSLAGSSPDGRRRDGAVRANGCHRPAPAAGADRLSGARRGYVIAQYRRGNKPRAHRRGGCVR